MAEIVVVGGCIIDLISYAKRFPKPGETIAGTQFSKGFGGKGANQCVMAKRLGANTALIAKLGDDTFGHEYLESCSASGIIYEHISFTKETHTSTANICVTEEGQNSIVYVPGAVMKLTPEDILLAEKMIKNAKILLCTFECPRNTLLEVLKLAKKHKVTTVVNAAPAPPQPFEELYSLIDIICLNEVEAEQTTNYHVQTVEEAGIAIKKLMEKNCSTVILTLGSKGAVFQSQDQPNFTHVPARIVTAVDSTGAGDAFMGALVYYLSRLSQLPLQEIIKRSCEIATYSVLKQGTQTSFPWRNDLPPWLFEDA